MVAAALAAVADYVVNGGIVALYMSIRMGVSPFKVIKILQSAPWVSSLLAI